MPEWGLFLRELILLRGCEKRGCEKILNSKISFSLFNNIQNCSATIGGSRCFNPLMPDGNTYLTKTAAVCLSMCHLFVTTSQALKG